MRRRVVATLVLALGLLAACTLPAGDPLAGLHPYVLPVREEVRLLTCRWEGRQPLGVALPADASPAERGALEAALRGWQRAGLGLELREVAPEAASIRLELVGGPVAREGDVPGAGRTQADCRVAADGAARLAGARVELARSAGPDWRGRERLLTPEELAGTAYHELGHALGFQGHPRGGRDPMERSVEGVRRVGERLLRGEAAPSAALRALYARPSGAILRRTPVSHWRTELVDRLAALAARRELDGPFLRVGDASARIFWREADGGEVGVLVPNLAETLRDPTRILVMAEPRARALLSARRSGP